MKYGVGSVILALIGIAFIVRINYQFSQDYIEFATKFEANGGVVPSIVRNNWIDRSIVIGISLLSFILGIKSYRKRNKIGFFGIILSVILFILVFFPLWSYIAYW